MKKSLIILVLLLVVIVGCGKKEEKFEKPEKIGNSDGLVLVYEDIRASVKNSPKHIISLYSDKRLVIETTNLDGFQEKHLSDREYQEIIDFAFSKEFMTLNKDLTFKETEGGTTSYITIYYDSTSRRVGGENVKNGTFSELINLLEK